MNFFIIGYSVFYVITSIALYFAFVYNDDDFRRDSTTDRIKICLFCFLPWNILIFISGLIFFCFHHVIKYIKEEYRKYAHRRLVKILEKEREEVVKQRDEILKKERDDKIKRGIIRISNLDPFGEENWNDDPPLLPQPPPDRILRF
jgi:hypothetical protein